MKITESQLRQIIKEEATDYLNADLQAEVARHSAGKEARNSIKNLINATQYFD